jgi:hypothetical protein
MSPECDPVSLGRLYTGLRLALEEGQWRGLDVLALRYAIIVNGFPGATFLFERQRFARRAARGGNPPSLVAIADH